MKPLSAELINAIEIFIDSKINNLRFDKTYIGTISSVMDDGYVVKYNGTEINIKTTQTKLYKVNDHVRLCLPCGNARHAYIDSLLN